MADEDKNLESDFQDFPDEELADIALLGDAATFDEEAIEKALKNIAAQMANASDEIKQLQQEALTETPAAADEASSEEFSIDLPTQESVEEVKVAISTQEQIASQEEAENIEENAVFESAEDVSDEPEVSVETSDDAEVENTVADTEISSEDDNKETETPDEVSEEITGENIEQTEEEIKPEAQEPETEAAEDTPEQPQEELQETAEQTDEPEVAQKQEIDADTPAADESQEENTQTDNKQEEVSKWEEIDDDNNVVKKYIVYISKDFVPVIDSLSVDQRSAYINDAIQIKIDAQDVQKQALQKRNAATHFVIALTVLILFTPVALLISNKAILATFDNYKYSQENFEKLYQQRFEKDKAYIRSVQYNKELEKKAKKQNNQKK